MADVSKVLVLLGSQSKYSSDRKFIDSVEDNVDPNKVEVIYYDGGHYIGERLIEKVVINRRW